MTRVLIVGALACAALAFFAWTSGLFLRCPHCRKIGAWRFDDAEPEKAERDSDGILLRTSQVRVCRGCGGRVLAKWADHEGRAIEKA
jgi:hypothetical protein